MTDADSFKLRPFTAERLVEVASRWTDLAGQEEFEVELGTFFDWCGAHLEHKEGDGYALELYNVTKGKTDAILDVNQGRWGTMTKLIKMHLSPEFWPIDTVSDDVVKTHAGAYATFISQGLGDGVNEVKIYGRSNVSVTMLTTLQKLWPNYNTGSVATMQGRWLSITRSEKKEQGSK